MCSHEEGHAVTYAGEGTQVQEGGSNNDDVKKCHAHTDRGCTLIMSSLY